MRTGGRSPPLSTICASDRVPSLRRRAMCTTALTRHTIYHSSPSSPHEP
jgi:hypothetical protein